MQSTLGTSIPQFVTKENIGFYITAAHKEYNTKDYDHTDSVAIGLDCGNIYLLRINHCDYT